MLLALQRFGAAWRGSFSLRSKHWMQGGSPSVIASEAKQSTRHAAVHTADTTGTDKTGALHCVFAIQDRDKTGAVARPRLAIAYKRYLMFTCTVTTVGAVLFLPAPIGTRAPSLSIGEPSSPVMYVPTAQSSTCSL